MKRSPLESLLRRTVASRHRGGGVEGSGRVPDGCPPARELARSADGLSAAPDRDRLASHLAVCERCATLWEYLVEVIEDGEGAATLGAGNARGEADAGAGAGSAGSRDPGAAVRSTEVRDRGRDRSNRPSPGIGWGAVAAGVTLLAVATWAYLTPPVRSTGDADWRGGPASLRADATRVDDASVRVYWEAWPEADAYRVRVWSAGGGLIVDERVGPRTTDAVLTLPRGGESRRWNVEALADGRIEAASAPRAVPP